MAAGWYDWSRFPCLDCMLDTYLYVNVSVTGEAFSIYLSHRKMFFDSFLVRSSPSAESVSAAETVRGLASATTWELGSTGTHGNDEGFVTLHHAWRTVVVGTESHDASAAELSTPWLSSVDLISQADTLKCCAASSM